MDGVTQLVRHPSNGDVSKEQTDITEIGTTVDQPATVKVPPSEQLQIQLQHETSRIVAASGYDASCSSDFSMSSQSSSATRMDSFDYCGSNCSIPISTCSVSSVRYERHEREVKTPVEIAFVTEPQKNPSVVDKTSKLLHLCSDTMVNIMTFLEPEEVVDVLTMPICKEWRKSYTTNNYIWKELCRMDPFKANVFGCLTRQPLPSNNSRRFAVSYHSRKLR